VPGSLTIWPQVRAANPLFYANATKGQSCRIYARSQDQTAQKPHESKLAKLGLRTDMDLVLHLPMRYEDETQIVPIREACLRGGHVSQVEGVVTKNEITYKPRRQLLVTIADDTGDILLRFMNFYGSQVKQLAEGTRVRARAEVRTASSAPRWSTRCTRSSTRARRCRPRSRRCIRPAKACRRPILRRAIADAMKRVDWADTVPPACAAPDGWPNSSRPCACCTTRRRKSTKRADGKIASGLDAHEIRRTAGPAAVAETRPAARRDKGRAGELQAPSAPCPKRSWSAALQADRRPAARGAGDPRRPARGYPMQRLLQGDVGSGKTVVAALAAAQAIDSGYQAALMAPTEILAEQHFRKIAAWMEPLGVKVAWLTGSLKKKDKQAASEMANRAKRLVIGTHALIQDTVQFAKLGLVIVDEQHRFGVGQRLTCATRAATAWCRTS
jgi:ATP-dependent DNA helicase RecG